MIYNDAPLASTLKFHLRFPQVIPHLMTLDTPRMDEETNSPRSPAGNPPESSLWLCDPGEDLVEGLFDLFKNVSSTIVINKTHVLNAENVHALNAIMGQVAKVNNPDLATHQDIVYLADFLAQIFECWKPTDRELDCDKRPWIDTLQKHISGHYIAASRLLGFTRGTGERYMRYRGVSVPGQRALQTEYLARVLTIYHK